MSAKGIRAVVEVGVVLDDEGDGRITENARDLTIPNNGDISLYMNQNSIKNIKRGDIPAAQWNCSRLKVDCGKR